MQPQRRLSNVLQMSRVEQAIERVKNLDENQAEALLEWIELRENRPGGLTLTMKLARFQAMTEKVNIAEFKDRLSELLDFVEQGGRIIVCRRNEPLARVEPIRSPKRENPQRSVIGCMKGSVRIHGDLTEPCIREEDWDMLK